MSSTVLLFFTLFFYSYVLIMLTNLYYLYYWFSVGEGTLPLHHLMAKIPLTVSSRNHTPTSSAPRPDLKNISHTDAASAAIFF
jgi:hypothetical protein